MQRLDSLWASTDLFKLPRCQTSGCSTTSLRVTPLSVRSRRLVAVDVIVSADRQPMAVETVEQIMFFVRSASYHCPRLVTGPAFRFSIAMSFYIGAMLFDITLPYWWNGAPPDTANRDGIIAPSASSFSLICFVVLVIVETPIVMWLRWGLMHVWWCGQTSDPWDWERRWSLWEPGPLLYIYILSVHMLFGLFWTKMVFGGAVFFWLWATVKLFRRKGVR